MDKLILSFFLLGFCFSGPLMAARDFEIVEGDIAVKKSGDKSSFLRSANRWPGGVIPWTIDQGDSDNTALLKSIKGAMDILNKYTNLVFKKRTSEDKNYIVFTSRNNGCFSYVGMQGGPQEINLSRGCHQDIIVSHEILHAIGMEHEQSRDDRDSYIDIKWENIREDQKHNFGMVKRSMFGEYNLNSIMHYGSYSFTKNDRPTMVTKQGQTFEQNLKSFTKGDQEAVNNFYPSKFAFDMSQIALELEPQGNGNTFVELKTLPEIIKSINSVVYKINNVEISNEISTWDNNFRYNFETKKGKNVIHITFNLKDETTEEAEYTYYYTGRKLAVDCRFTAKRDSVDFTVPVGYEGEETSEESRKLKDYFANVTAVFNTSTNTMELHMSVGRTSGIFRSEQKEEEIFTIIDSETQKIKVDKAELTCHAVNEPN